MPKHKVAVIEDNDINMKLVKTLLDLAGFDVVAAEDAETGIDMIREHRPDLILMDMQLPGMDGLSATKIIKQDEALKSIPVVALTSYSMQGDEERADQAGCSGYISKPIDTRNFAKNVNQYIGSNTNADVPTELA